MAFDYDLIVIGSGPAGEKAAVKAAYFGKRVALVERAVAVGGTCVTGGLPSKILRESAFAYSGARRRLGDVFERMPGQSLQMASFLGAVDTVCRAREQRVQANFASHGVELISGTASFENEHTVVVTSAHGTRTSSAAVVVIATGSRPKRPASIPFDDSNVFCSDTILSMPLLPRSMIVVGAGVIGSEYASIFSALDVDVHLINEQPTIIGFLDEEISEHLLAEFGRRGIRTYLGQRVKECRADRATGVEVTLTSGATVRADTLLFSGGRVSNTDSLGLDRIGVKLLGAGRPQVDEFFRTTVPHIYAVGDVIGFPALASTSMEQGRVAVGHAFDLDPREERPDAVRYAQTVPYPLVPYGIYTIPGVSMVGKTEQQLVQEGRPYVVGRSSYRDQDRGHLIGDVDGMLKLLCDRETRKVLGVHIVGETAEELIHIGQACMHFGGTIEYFLRSVFNFPTMAGLYKAASYDVLTRLASADR